jgi:hypothetical protein
MGFFGTELVATDTVILDTLKLLWLDEGVPMVRISNVNQLSSCSYQVFLHRGSRIECSETHSNDCSFLIN